MHPPILGLQLTHGKLWDFTSITLKLKNLMMGLFAIVLEELRKSNKANQVSQGSFNSLLGQNSPYDKHAKNTDM